MDWKPEAIEAGIAEWLSDPSRSNEATIQAILDAAVEAQGVLDTISYAIDQGRILGRAEAFEEAAKEIDAYRNSYGREWSAMMEVARRIRALAKESPK